MLILDQLYYDDVGTTPTWGYQTHATHPSISFLLSSSGWQVLLEPNLAAMG